MKWLLIDSHYVCHRAYHALKELTHQGVQTAVVFGVLSELVGLTELHETCNLAFCFDSKESKRRELYPEYKSSRRSRHEEATEEEQSARAELDRQIDLLRDEYLPEIGYRNIFLEEGLEADDLLASIVLNKDEDDEMVIVSADEDLWQLISPTVSVWNCHKKVMYQESNFDLAYGIPPRDWRKVKAIAGCTSDDVRGVEGVGPVTALRYLKGEMKETSKRYRQIKDSKDVIQRNMKLTSLPFKGTPIIRLSFDEPMWKGWQRVCNRIGASSLLNRTPANIRRPRVVSRHGFGLE